jgi:hypothetical protein
MGSQPDNSFHVPMLSGWHFEKSESPSSNASLVYGPASNGWPPGGISNDPRQADICPS